MIQVLRYTEELEKAGFTAEQAKKSVQLWMDLMDQNFATKADFKEHYFMAKSDLLKLEGKVALKADLDVQINELGHKLEACRNELETFRNEFETFRIKLESKFINFEHSLIIKLGAMLAGAVGLLAALIMFRG
jgi:hypothetical protein